MISLSIIIVSYNTKDLLKQTLDSVYASNLNKLTLEVFVVDNASSDGSHELVEAKYPRVKLIKSDQNLGFAKANNLALKKTSGRYILLLNSDTKLNKNTLSGMVSFMESHPEAGVAGCRLELADGTLDWACHRGFPTPLNALCYFLHLEHLPLLKRLTGGYHLTWLDLGTTHEIDTPSGAFYLVRKSLVKKIGLLDEDYFMYGEDIDWSYRYKQSGHRIYYVPEFVTTHYKKKSGRDKTGDTKQQTKTRGDFFSTMKLFYQKYYLDKYPKWVTKLSFFAIDILSQIKN